MADACVYVCAVQMEDTTPPVQKGAPTHNDLEPLQCDLSELMDDDEFSFGVPVPVLPERDATSSVILDIEDEVCKHTCYCQASPNTMPPNFTPCCLPLGVQLASRSIHMFPEFRGNLLRLEGEPAKTQTLRNWSKDRADEHRQSFLDGKWIRVWRGQGHKDTIGWLLITCWKEVKVRDIGKNDCIREGRPTWDPKMFKYKYCNGLPPDFTLIRVRFEFRGCRACMEQ